MAKNLRASFRNNKPEIPKCLESYVDGDEPWEFRAADGTDGNNDMWEISFNGLKFSSCWLNVELGAKGRLRYWIDYPTKEDWDWPEDFLMSKKYYNPEDLVPEIVAWQLTHKKVD